MIVFVPLPASSDGGHEHVSTFVLALGETAARNGHGRGFVRGVRLTHPTRPSPHYGARAVIRIEVDGDQLATVLGDHAVARMPMFGVGARAVFTVEAPGISRATLIVEIERADP